ncbi:hypothetical protein V1478_002238 [Vespula squamosa]|uniref:Uncharacterized protein n=1 Tax=Vespula squamosa TaxID=30214 RepID=A0ABD2BW34_VESSQ
MANIVYKWLWVDLENSICTDNASFVNYYLHYSINIKKTVALHIPKKMRKKREYYATLNSMFQNGWKIITLVLRNKKDVYNIYCTSVYHPSLSSSSSSLLLVLLLLLLLLLLLYYYYHHYHHHHHHHYDHIIIISLYFINQIKCLYMTKALIDNQALLEKYPIILHDL